MRGLLVLWDVTDHLDLRVGAYGFSGSELAAAGARAVLPDLTGTAAVIGAITSSSPGATGPTADRGGAWPQRPGPAGDDATLDGNR